MEQPPRLAQPTHPSLYALAALERDASALREAWGGALPAWETHEGGVQAQGFEGGHRVLSRAATRAAVKGARRRPLDGGRIGRRPACPDDV